ncbi:hypothetical protein HONESTABE_274 [Bacillus phage HonestAbe]|nr:hypothetical protein HONESTABE_274 [Bacillus phage HonestAbe]
MTEVILTNAEETDKILFVSDLIKSFQRIQKGKQFRFWYRDVHHVDKPLKSVDGRIANSFLQSFDVKSAFDEITNIQYQNVEQIIFLENGSMYDLRADLFKHALDITETALFKYLTNIDEKRILITVIAKDMNYKIIRNITGRIDVVNAESEVVVVRHDDSPSQCTEIGFEEIMSIQERLQNEDSIEFTFINNNLWRSTK